MGMAAFGDILNQQGLRLIGITKTVYVGNTMGYGTASVAFGSQVTLPTWENILLVRMLAELIALKIYDTS